VVKMVGNRVVYLVDVLVLELLWRQVAHPSRLKIVITLRICLLHETDSRCPPPELDLSRSIPNCSCLNIRHGISRSPETTVYAACQIVSQL
jgi:hypothetical protein